ncbi:MAG TPA: hypothetical protein VHX87_05555 [Galbitalea sp.]|nr:hypothetical protein [Galbitalea sp.]
MRVVTAVLVALGGALATIGLLQISGLALFGALSASIATASRAPRRLTSWIPAAIIFAAIVTVVLADQFGIGTHHDGA